MLKSFQPFFQILEISFRKCKVGVLISWIKCIVGHVCTFWWLFISVSNQTGFVPEPRDSIQTGTLDRHTSRSSGGGPSYPLYHTCNRQSNKKKVTIVDNEGKIDDGSKVWRQFCTFVKDMCIVQETFADFLY